MDKSQKFQEIKAEYLEQNYKYSKPSLIKWLALEVTKENLTVAEAKIILNETLQRQQKYNAAIEALSA